LGRYEYDGDRLRICIGKFDAPRQPISFRAEDCDFLLILDRVKLGK
jgi:hypothetical protein